MTHRTCGVLLCLALISGGALAQPGPDPKGTAPAPKPAEQPPPEAAQPREGDDLVAVLEKPGELVLVALGFQSSEGPLWDPEHNQLLVCDMSRDGIYGVPLAGHPLEAKELVQFRVPSQRTWGIARDLDGGILCAENTRKVEKVDKDGKNPKTLASEFEGKPLNNPNDIVAGSAGGARGWVYFTDPPFGTPKGEGNLEFHGLFRVSADGPKIEALARDLDLPNGLAFNAGCTKLYVSEYRKGVVHEYPVKEDGSLGEGRVFADMSGYGKGADGLKVDTAGNVFATGGGAVQVFGPDGSRLGRIGVPGRASNVGFGGEDGRSLFVTCGKNVVYIRTKNPGANLPWLSQGESVRPAPPAAEPKAPEGTPAAPQPRPEPPKEPTPG
jgi:gluconolactonase